MRRVDAMAALIKRDVDNVIYAAMTIEAANNLQKENNLFASRIYHAGVRHGLFLHLAACLARLYDPFSDANWIGPWPRNKKEIGSISLLVPLLRQKRCRTVLVERARNWNPLMPDLAASNVKTCEREISSAVSVYKKLRSTYRGRKALSSLQKFRNNALAHSLMKDTDGIQLSELFFLAEAARDFAHHAIFAVEGKAYDFRNQERIVLKEATEFWSPIFGGRIRFLTLATLSSV